MHAIEALEFLVNFDDCNFDDCLYCWSRYIAQMQNVTKVFKYGSLSLIW